MALHRFSRVGPHGAGLRPGSSDARHASGAHPRELVRLGSGPRAADNVIATAHSPTRSRALEVVFEAGPEEPCHEATVFLRAGGRGAPSAILASNTSVIPITQIMAPLKHKERALGTHWWNPPYLVPLVELIRHRVDGDGGSRSMTALLTAAGKTPVTVRRTFLASSATGCNTRYGAKQSHSCKWRVRRADRRHRRQGELRSAPGRAWTAGERRPRRDRSHTRHSRDGAARPRSHARPAAYLRDLVASGRLGMKSGEGFQRWTPEQQAELRKRVFEHLRRSSSRHLIATREARPMARSRPTKSSSPAP